MKNEPMIYTMRLSNPNKGVGLHIHVPKGESVHYESVAVSNCFIGLIKTGEGELLIDDLWIHHFGGDAVVLKAGNITVLRTVIEECLHTRPYNTLYFKEFGETVDELLVREGVEVYNSDLLEVRVDSKGVRSVQGFHCDAIQMYAVKDDGYTLDSEGVISDVFFDDITVRGSDPKFQCFMLSERNRYTNINIGAESLLAEITYPYLISAVSLDNSTIGGKYVNIGSSTVRVGNIKDTTWASYDNSYPGIVLEEDIIQEEQSQDIPEEEEFEVAFIKLVGLEGRYSKDPNDRGNWDSGVIGKGTLRGTKYGISSMSYPTVDIVNLTKERAKELYYRDYWEPMGLPSLPTEIHYPMFDAAVNSGVSNSKRFLQKALGVSVDGMIGEVTLSAVRDLPPLVLRSKLLGVRLKFMTNTSSWKHHGRGWARRIAKLLEEI